LASFKELNGFELETKKLPKLAAWVERMILLPAVNEIIIKPEAYLKIYTRYSSGEPIQYDSEE
jgi:hypothetical protein